MRSPNSKHDIGPVLEHYGFTLPMNRQGWITVRCAFHNDKVKSARLNLDNGGFRCFACDMSGDVYSIIMKKEGVKYGEAIKIAERITGKSHGELRSQPAGDSSVSTESRYNRGNGSYVPPRVRKGA
jgi:DNA primase